MSQVRHTQWVFGYLLTDHISVRKMICYRVPLSHKHTHSWNWPTFVSFITCFYFSEEIIDFLEHIRVSGGCKRQASPTSREMRSSWPRRRKWPRCSSLSSSCSASAGCPFRRSICSPPWTFHSSELCAEVAEVSSMTDRTKCFSFRGINYIWMASHILAMSNSSCNPIIYGIYNVSSIKSTIFFLIHSLILWPVHAGEVSSRVRPQVFAAVAPPLLHTLRRRRRWRRWRRRRRRWKRNQSHASQHRHHRRQGKQQ